MGFNFGVVVIGYDLRQAIGELEPARRQFHLPGESPDERAAKRLIDAGTVLCDQLNLAVIADDANETFGSAIDGLGDGGFSRAHFGVRGGVSVLVSASLAIEQTARRADFEQLSRRRGPTSVFWFNDASGSYVMSVFREGQRVRFFSRGEGMHADEGPPLPTELSPTAHPFDTQCAVLAAAVGCSFHELLDLNVERFSVMS